MRNVRSQGLCAAARGRSGTLGGSASARAAGRLALAMWVAGAGPVFGAGFQINENSASGLGNAFAGGAAAAEDAATLWSNAAGMARLGQRQVAGAIHLITPSIKFRNDFSAPASQQAQGGDGGDAGGLNVVPNLYFVMPLDRQWALGLGINAPWGLVTDYDDGWVGRFQADKSDIRTVNVNPAVSYRVDGRLSLGLGVNVQRIDATFTNQVNYSAALLQAAAQNGIAPGSATYNAIAQATPGLESSARIKGNDTAYGWNAGLLWEIGPDQRVGVHYRSAVSYDVTGDATFANPTPTVAGALAPTVAALAAGLNGTVLFDSGVSAKVKLPPIANLSFLGRLDSRWDVMADAQWTGWSTIKDLTFVRANGSTLSSTPENFKDVWKLAAGANYRLDDRWLFRGGAAYDRSPVQREFRTPRLPDNDRTWLTLGAQYKWGPTMWLDVGAGYVWVKEASINKSGDPPNVLGNGLLNGQYRSSVTILSVQLTSNF
ncbi:MAG: outer membrane protein transport protein [Rubrivivax sp.]|nr:outer membrane protein transport protein [Rubrivivax sp.]